MLPTAGVGTAVTSFDWVGKLYLGINPQKSASNSYGELQNMSHGHKEKLTVREPKMFQAMCTIDVSDLSHFTSTVVTII